jgi:hypothetical protein
MQTTNAADVEREWAPGREAWPADDDISSGHVYSLGRLGLELYGIDLAEQAAQEPRELHGSTVVARTSLGAALRVLERRHRVEHDAQVVLP